MSLDYIEMLVNKYNYMAKLIEDNYVRDGSATGLSLDNMRGNYKRVRPLIELRRAMAPNYAKHYVKYCAMRGDARRRERS